MQYHHHHHRSTASKNAKIAWSYPLCSFEILQKSVYMYIQSICESIEWHSCKWMFELKEQIPWGEIERWAFVCVCGKEEKYEKNDLFASETIYFNCMRDNWALISSSWATILYFYIIYIYIVRWMDRVDCVERYGQCQEREREKESPLRNVPNSSSGQHSTVNSRNLFRLIWVYGNDP